MSRWRERGVGHAGVADIERDVLGQNLALKDVADVALVIAGKENRVVRQVINLVEAEIQHERGTGILPRVHVFPAVLP